MSCAYDSRPSPILELPTREAERGDESPSGSLLGTATAEAPLLTVVIPVYNERNTILSIIERTRRVMIDTEIVVVDDGSTDGTGEVIRQVADRRVHIVHHDRNRGKGAAIRTGLGCAHGEYVIIQDADLEYDPSDFSKLLIPLVEGRALAVYGSRYLRHGGHKWRLLREGVRLLNWIARILYGVRLTDEATCYKIMPTELMRGLELQCERFEFCPEITAKLCRLGIPIVEVPISYTPRTVEDGKKIRVSDGWEAIRTLWKFRHWSPSEISPRLRSILSQVVGSKWRAK